MDNNYFKQNYQANMSTWLGLLLLELLHQSDMEWRPLAFDSVEV